MIMVKPHKIHILRLLPTLVSSSRTVMRVAHVGEDHLVHDQSVPPWFNLKSKMKDMTNFMYSQVFPKKRLYK